MKASQDDIHSSVVERWLTASAHSPLEEILLLEKAFRIIQARAGLTLSHVTLMVVLDRILQQGLEEHPILHQVTIENQVLNFTIIKRSRPSEEASSALSFLLAELLRVLGRITADILTKTLHKELMEINLNESRES